MKSSIWAGVEHRTFSTATYMCCITQFRKSISESLPMPTKRVGDPCAIYYCLMVQMRTSVTLVGSNALKPTNPHLNWWPVIGSLRIGR